MTLPSGLDNCPVKPEGPASVYLCHCEEAVGRRTPGWLLLPLRGNSPSGNPFSFRSLWDRAALRTAGDADCHGLRPRNDVVIFTRSFCLWRGPDTPGGVSLREFFGIMRIELSLHGRAVGLRPPLRENSEFLSAGHLASGILDMV